MVAVQSCSHVDVIAFAALTDGDKDASFSHDQPDSSHRVRGWSQKYKVEPYVRRRYYAEPPNVGVAGGHGTRARTGWLTAGIEWILGFACAG